MSLVPHNDDQDWIDNGNRYSKRTVAELNQDLAHGDARVTGTDHNSISKKPILPLRIDLDHLVPPCLHTELGLTVRYFRMLEEECRLQDFGTLEDRHVELYNKWQDASISVEDAKLEMEEVEGILTHEKELLEGFKKSREGRNEESAEDEPCSLLLCALQVNAPSSVDPDDVKWLQCTQCGEGQENGCFIFIVWVSVLKSITMIIF